MVPPVPHSKCSQTNQRLKVGPVWGTKSKLPSQPVNHKPSIRANPVLKLVFCRLWVSVSIPDGVMFVEHRVIDQVAHMRWRY